MATTNGNPPHDWPNLRRSLERFNATLARLTSDLEDIFVALDGEPSAAPVLELVFDEPVTVSATVEPQPHRRMVDTPNRNRPWTDDEHNDLRAMFRYGLTDPQMAEFLGRSVDSIERRRGVLGLLRNA